MSETKAVKTNWVVVTGPPSSGKSTLVNALKSKKFNTVPDVARKVIEQEKSENRLKDEQQRQSEIIARQNEYFDSLDKRSLVFLDYSMIDHLVFQKFYGVINEDLLRSCDLLRYKAVFLLEPVGLELDGIRSVNEAQQNKLFDNIFRCYSEYGYRPIIVANMSLDKRINFLLDNLDLSR